MSLDNWPRLRQTSAMATASEGIWRKQLCYPFGDTATVAAREDGDLFNLWGCKLEPTTLPTQFYVALLYTGTTVILAAQVIYYGHIYHRLKANKISQFDKGSKDQVGMLTDGTNVSVEGPHRASSPIPVLPAVRTPYGSNGCDLYHMSVGSLSRSRTPTSGSYLSPSREAGGTSPILITNQNPIKEPLLGGHISVQSAPPLNTKNTFCVVSAVTFFLCGFNLHLSMNNRSHAISRMPHQGVIIHVARRLLQINGGSSFGQETEGSSGVGTILGWAMAIIYMGGRLPQICLNIRRGKVEGLNPLMFVFALVGNVTYVASILVSSLDCSKLRPNFPWLVDAGGCVFLDFFILSQFMYFKWKHRGSRSSHEHIGTD